MENTKPTDNDVLDMIEEANEPAPSQAAINMANNANGAIPATQPTVVSSGR